MDLNDLDNDWANDAPRLIAIGNKNPFNVPDKYFKESFAQIQRHKKILELSQAGEAFEIPADYFEGLTENINSRILLEQNLAQPGLAVPENYFEDLSSRIIAKTKPAKIRRINPLRSWISYAAAAAVLVAVTTGILINKEHNTLHYKLSDVPDQEIINYLELHADAGDTQEIIDNLGRVPAIGKDVPDNTLQQDIDSTL
ncbi:hypothetical protein GS399_07630 [Pedobacter sp. HMF7647]|uniref:Uncharacterized protein n=1 Tax=Hufsiella arboris TaxID=2695275 RepID=A0A7K1Y8Z6_9SPHI|nr:hypothetical protein [Hufsiella arboris]MXV50841.1 hypothetical protein [Hufsiella arboris]